VLQVLLEGWTEVRRAPATSGYVRGGLGDWREAGGRLEDWREAGGRLEDWREAGGREGG